MLDRTLRLDGYIPIHKESANFAMQSIQTADAKCTSATGITGSNDYLSVEKRITYITMSCILLVMYK